MRPLIWFDALQDRLRERRRHARKESCRRHHARRVFLEPLEPRLLLASDFGDAPDSGAGTGPLNYNTRSSDNGPSHVIVPGLLMGGYVDDEPDAQPNTGADGDDLHFVLPDDEDGLVSPVEDLSLTIGSQPQVDVLVTNTTAADATLNGWIDYDHNGLFDNATERAQLAVTSGTLGIVTLVFPTVPAGSTGRTYARFRLSTDVAAANPTGAASDGEVEDYTVTITAPGPGVISHFTKIAHETNGGPSLIGGTTFAAATASLGDLNGDGVNDLAVGAPWDSVDGFGRGAVHVFLMNTDGTVQSFTKIGHQTAGGPSLADEDNFGRSVAAIGDLDGDGVPDLAVGAPRDDTGGNARGAVYVLLMNSDGTAKSVAKIGDEIGGGPNLGSGGFGASVTSIGDFDGDGVLDMAVPGGGDIYLLMMNPGGTAKGWIEIPNEGGFLADLGDLDGDGVTDLAAGKPSYWFERGAVDVLFLNADGSVKSKQRITDQQGGGPDLTGGDLFGGAITPMGDLDGDGVTDMVVGAYLDSTGGDPFTARGAVYVLFMNPDGTAKRYGKIAHQLGGGPALAERDFFGRSVASLGDLNNDGLTDLAVGASGDDTGVSGGGAVYVMFQSSFDLGDAPDTATGTSQGNYETLFVDDGPRHGVVDGLLLGVNIDTDDGALQSGNADADDVDQATPDDEDALSIPAADLTLIIGTSPQVNLTATNSTPVDAVLRGWIDYNHDGLFSSFEDARVTVPSGTDHAQFTMSFPVVTGGFTGTTYARFRLTTDPFATGPTGFAFDGEVEDYVVTIARPGVPEAVATEKIAHELGGGPTLANGDFFGVSLTSAGDLNGDGVVDLVAGARSDDTGGPDRGAVYVLLMNTDGTVKSRQKIADGTGGGPALVDDGEFGSSVVSLGDLDADGVTDLAVGAYNDGSGVVYVLFMNANGTVKSTQKIANQTGGGPSLSGSAEFGTSLAVLGDLDGDGVTDLAVGAGTDDVGANPNANRGAVYVLMMNADGTVKSHQQIADNTGGGPALSNDDRFGSSVAALGDLDGDGVTDLVVGARQVSASGRGAVYVLFMNANGTVRSSRKITDATNGGPALAARDDFGVSVTSLGDLDGDGITDIAVGAMGDDTNGSQRGAVHVLLMNADGTIKNAHKIADQTGGGPTLANGDLFGVSVANLGDLNGDGVIDLAAGAQLDDTGGTDRGAVHVLFLGSPVDFGDAPDTGPGTGAGNYNTLAGDSGPSHTVVDGLFMGGFADGDDGTLQDTAAAADNMDRAIPIDEDGSNLPVVDLHLTIGPPPDVHVTVTNTTGAEATLYGWIDYNADGVFDNATEGAQAVVANGTWRGVATLSFPAVPLGVAGTTYARFRLSTDPAAAAPTGGAWDGEVEDHAVTIHAPAVGVAESTILITEGMGGGPDLTQFDHFGSNLTSLGDVDGDGLNDLAAGVFPDDTGGASRGAVYILFMQADGTVRESQKIAHQTGGGPDLVDYDDFGSGVAPLGDLNGDGVVDVAVTAVGDNQGGAIYILYLNSNGTVKNFQKNVPREEDVVFGGNLAGLGDVNGDGFPDLALSDPSDGSRGAIRLVFLDADGTVLTSRKIGHQLNGGPTLPDNDSFGAAFAAFGDLDGDGVTELAVGARHDSDGNFNGAVHVLFLNSNGTVKTSQLIGDQIGGGPDLETNEFFGWSLAALGDLNGDGVPDLAAGAEGDKTSGSSAGAVHFLLMNPDGTVKSSRKIADETNGGPTLQLGAKFGSAITLLGDLNGDGVVDLGVGAHDYDGDDGGEGAVYTVFLSLQKVLSITRHTPPTSPTLEDEVTFRLTFLRDAQNVTDDDFTLSGTAAGDGTIASVTPVSASVYDILVTGLTDSNGTINLDFAAGNDIQDGGGNPLGDSPGIGVEEEFVIDNTPPVLMSFTRQTPAGIRTNADSLIFRAIFDEDVTGVDVGDFSVDGATTATVTNVVQVTADAYDVTVSGGDLADLNDDLGLDLAGSPTVTDLAGNALPAGEPATDETYVVDNISAVLTSFTRQNPATSPTNADSLVFRVVFNEDVTDVDTTDFTVDGATTATPTLVIQISGTTYDVTVAGGDLANVNGFVGLDLSGGQDIIDVAGNALPAGEPATDEQYLLDNIAPYLLSFTRWNPVSSPTHADTLVFRARFASDVIGVDPADFAVNGTTSAMVTGVAQVDGTTFDVTVSGGDLAGFNGTVGLDLAAGQNITDLAGNALSSDEPVTDETYVVDNAAPTLISFARQAPASSLTREDTLVFRATFDEDVTAVNQADFAINGLTTAAVTAVVQVSSSVYDVTVSGGDLAGFNGPVGLDVAAGQDIVDRSGLALASVEPATDETYLVDNTAPALLSFTRQTPATSPTRADTLVLRATFDEAVTGVGDADFVVDGTTTASVTNVTQVAGDTYDVTLSGGDLADFDGSLGLNLSAGQDISDLAGNLLPTAEPATDETFIVDNTPPDLTSFARLVPVASATHADALVFRATFDEGVTGVDATDFTVDALTTASVSQVTQVSADAYDVTVSGGDLAAFNGTVGLNLFAGQDIADVAGNALPAGEPLSDELYTLDNDAPAVASFKRLTPAVSPTNADALTFQVRFDENVTDVDDADFVVNGATTASITAVTPVTGRAFNITVSGGDLPELNGTVGLDLAGGQDITDLAGNALVAGEPAADETYLVDHVVPAAVSFLRLTPATSPTNADTLIFRASFDEVVLGVDAADFAAGGTTTAQVTDVTLVTASTYDVTVSGGDLADFNGAVGLDLAVGISINDLAGNALSALEPGSDEVYDVDNASPLPTIGSSESDPSNAAQVPIFVDFGEVVAGFTVGDLAVGGGTASNFSTSDNQVFTFDVAPAGDGTITVGIAASTAQDQAGNASVAAAPFSMASDRTAPTLLSFTRQTPAGSSTNADTLAFLATFDEDVTGVGAGDFVVQGTSATVTQVTQSTPATYLLFVSGGDLAGLNATVQMDLAGVQDITDLAGNVLPTTEPATDETFLVDNDAPQLLSFSRLTPANSPTHADSLVFLATFSELVTGVDSGDFALDSTTTAALTAVQQATGSTYEVTVSGGDLAAFNGTVGLDLAIGQDIGDPAGNALPSDEPSIDEGYNLDNTSPIPVIHSTAADPSTAAVIPVTVDFGEVISGFAASDLTVSGGAVSNFGTSDNQVFALDLIPSQDGTVTVSIASSVAQDLAGNDNVAAAPFAIDSDRTSPILLSFTRQSPAASPTSADTVVFRVTFDEEVNGVDVGAFVVDGATTAAVSSVAPVSGSVYDVTVSGGDLADFNGLLGLNLGAAQSITDPAGNPLPSAEPATDETYLLDNNSPAWISLVRQLPSANPTNADVLSFRLAFDEDVVGVGPSDFAVDGASTATVTQVARINGTTYDVTLSGGDLAVFNGTVGLGLSAAQNITDLAGNPLLPDDPASIESFDLDNVAPLPAFQAADNDPTNAAAISLSVDFAEVVVGFDSSDLAVVGGTVGNFATSDNRLFTFDVSPSNDGTITASITAAAAQDQAGNDSAFGEFSIRSDRTGPSPAIHSTAPDPTSAAAIPLSVDFGETVVGFTVADLAVGGGSVSNFNTTDDQHFTFDVTPIQDGLITVDIAASVTQDQAGNANSAAAQFAIESDRTAPMPIISSTETDPTAASVIPVSVEFGEVVSGFTQSDLTIGRGSASGFSTADGRTYTFNIFPAGNGSVTVDVAAAVALDSAGNGNSAAVPFSIQSDRLSPRILSFTRQDPAGSSTNSDTLVFRATFDEEVTAVDEADFAVDGAPAATVTSVSQVTAVTFDVTVFGNDLNGTVGMNMAGGQDITDLAGNALPLGEPLTDETYEVDRIAPQLNPITRLNPQQPLTNADVLTFRATFDEDVTGVDAADFQLQGATTAAITKITSVNARIYDLTVSGGNLAGFNGLVSLSVALAASVHDSVGNPLSSDPSGHEAYTVDNDAPAITSFTRHIPTTTPTNEDALVFRVLFDEDVTGVSMNDFAVSGTTANVSHLLPVDAATYDVTVSGGDLAGFSGTVGLNLAGSQDIADLAGNSLPAADPLIDETFAMDNMAPVLSSFARHDPATSPTNADTLVFRATFDDGVMGVDAGDFSVQGPTTATVTNVSQVDAATYDVTVAGGDLGGISGSVGLNLAGSQDISDLVGNPLGNTEPAIDEEYQLVGWDLGDAPTAQQTGFASSYPTTIVDDGARHTVGALYLGQQVDADVDGQPDGAAGQGGSGGDDNTGADDEDGVFPVAGMVTTNAATRSSFAVVASGAGFVDAWIDFNQDGDWSEADEQIFDSVSVGSGLNVLTFTVPAGALSGSTGARFRLSSAGGLSPTGLAADGEVEDYMFSVLAGAAPGANVSIVAPVAGQAEVTAAGSDLVVRLDTLEVFRAPGGALSRIHIVGTDGDDAIRVGNVQNVFTGLIGGDAGGGYDRLQLTGDGQVLDLTAIDNADLQGIEAIDISGSGHNTLSLNDQEVIHISSTTDTLDVRSNRGDTVDLGSGWTFSQAQIVNGDFVRVLTQGTATIHLIGPSDWTNPIDPLDVNANGSVEPFDALNIVNELNTRRYTNADRSLVPAASVVFPGFFFDASPDGFAVPLDVLAIINFLNLQNVSPEGEAGGAYGARAAMWIGNRSEGSVFEARTENGASAGLVQAGPPDPLQAAPDAVLTELPSWETQRAGTSRKVLTADEFAAALDTLLTDRSWWDE